MSKFFWIPVVLALASTTSAASSAQQKRPAASSSAARLPIFDFLGQNTEAPATMTMLNSVKCDAGASGKISCTDYNDPAIGGVILSFISLGFYNGKLYSVAGSGGRYTFPELLRAFTAKYGPPRIETRKWQNRVGGTLDNKVAVWKFKGGNLELAAIGSRMGDVDFEFLSILNAPPAPPAKVDF